MEIQSPNSRKKEVTLTRLRIGHSYETYFHLLNGEPPSECRRCRIPRSVRHVLLECPHLKDIRKRFLGYDPVSSGKSLDSLLGEEAPVDSLISYLSAIKYQIIFKIL